MLFLIDLHYLQNKRFFFITITLSYTLLYVQNHSNCLLHQHIKLPIHYSWSHLRFWLYEQCLAGQLETLSITTCMLNIARLCFYNWPLFTSAVEVMVLWFHGYSMYTCRHPYISPCSHGVRVCGDSVCTQIFLGTKPYYMLDVSISWAIHLNWNLIRVYRWFFCNLLSVSPLTVMYVLTYLPMFLVTNLLI